MTILSRVRRHRSRGQSTVEFMLMIPVIFAMFFFVIEMGLYFSAIHYTNYATYTVARSRLASYRTGSGTSSASTVASWIMTGSALRGNYTVTETSGGIAIQLRSWKTNFPYLSALMPNMPYRLEVDLGKPEIDYESKARSSNSSQGLRSCADNDMSASPC